MRKRGEMNGGGAGLERSCLRRKSFWCLLALMLGWMVVIWLFSGQNGEESSQQSGEIVEYIRKLLGCIFHDATTVENLVGGMEWLVRKAAHMAEYAVLAVLARLWLGTWLPRKQGWLAAAAWGVAVAYAATDEWHQVFVADRSGKLSDVGIDAVGACLGLLLFAGVLWLCKRRRA